MPARVQQRCRDRRSYSDAGRWVVRRPQRRCHHPPVLRRSTAQAFPSSSQARSQLVWSSAWIGISASSGPIVNRKRLHCHNGPTRCRACYFCCLLVAPFCRCTLQLAQHAEAFGCKLCLPLGPTTDPHRSQCGVHDTHPGSQGLEGLLGRARWPVSANHWNDDEAMIIGVEEAAATANGMKITYGSTQRGS